MILFTNGPTNLEVAMTRKALVVGGIAVALSIAVPLAVLAAGGSSGGFLPQNDV